MMQRIFGGMMAVVVAIAAAVCPCTAKAAPPVEPSADAHACCREKKATPGAPAHPARSDHRCGHCDGSRILAMNPSKAAPAIAPPLPIDWLAPAMDLLAGASIGPASTLSPARLPLDHIDASSLLAQHCALTL